MAYSCHGSFERNHESDRGTFGRRRKAQTTSKQACSCPKILQTVTSGAVARTRIRRWDHESVSIIANLANNLVVKYAQLEHDRVTRGVAHRVDDGLFENQEYVPALFRVQFDFVKLRRHLKMP